MTRRDRITILLEFFRDVEEGISDYALRDEAGVPLRLMGEAWNHPSYRHLRDLLPELARADPEGYWHLAETYLRWRPNGFRRVAYCTSCRRESPAARIGEVHRHGSKTFTLLPRMSKPLNAAIEQERVERCIDWLEEREWPVFLPETVMAVMGRGHVAA